MLSSVISCGSAIGVFTVCVCVGVCVWVGVCVGVCVCVLEHAGVAQTKCVPLALSVLVQCVNLAGVRLSLVRADILFSAVRHSHKSGLCSSSSAPPP